ncbi:LytTR family DNA-binding domain-containing protein [Cesiribacter sp. SM1]|uniref:LytR/AlgR family response regulator transcription factor n=1 Tax=Cesiribacter sp. SM1 TaxID=2861196 RepID=UPI001CD3FCD9|nr:LytTR family transcriptional regulator DNA-binding domain-containing protein [Cesiribacter sp. SM1]
MAKIRILAAEDDALHADTLRMVMDRLGYELIDIVDTPAELLRQLKATQPDVLLMDIDLGVEETGIDLVKKINESADIPVIYVTSHKEEAIFKKAKETMPEAYIIKPYDPEHLQAAIELAVFKKQKEANQPHSRTAQPTPLKAVFVKEGNSLVKLQLQDIALVEAYDKYCYLYTRDKKHLLNNQLKNLIQLLPQELFLQVHRSYLVNLDAVEKIRPQQNSIEVAGKQVPVSKSFKAALYAHLTTI